MTNVMWVRTSVRPTSGHNFLQSEAHKLTTHLPPNMALKHPPSKYTQYPLFHYIFIQLCVTSATRGLLKQNRRLELKGKRTFLYDLTQRGGGKRGENRSLWWVLRSVSGWPDSNTETVLWLISSKAIWLFGAKTHSCKQKTKTILWSNLHE